MIDMHACIACGHPGSDHYSGPQRERGKCTIRHKGRRCMCSQYILNSDERTAVNGARSGRPTHPSHEHRRRYWNGGAVQYAGVA